MRRLEEWGGEPELLAAASIFGFQIHIYHPFFHDGVQVIQAPVKKHVEKEEVDVHLLYYGDHYDVAYHVSRPFDPESGKRRKIEEPGHSTVESESESESRKRRKTEAAEENGEGPAEENGEGPSKVYKARGQSATGRRLSSELRSHGMGLSKKR